MKRIRVLLVTDNSLISQGLFSMLKKHQEIKMELYPVGDGNPLPEVRGRAAQMVFIDAGMNRETTWLLIEHLKTNLPRVKFVILGIAEDDDRLLEFVRAGVTAFVVKGESSQELLQMIKRMVDCRISFPTALVGSLLRQIEKDAVVKSKMEVDSAIALTKREQEVIRLVSEGLTNKDIGRLLSVSLNTVKSHVHNIFEKSAVRSRGQLGV